MAQLNNLKSEGMRALLWGSTHALGLADRSALGISVLHLCCCWAACRLCSCRVGMTAVKGAGAYEHLADLVKELHNKGKVGHGIPLARAVSGLDSSDSWTHCWSGGAIAGAGVVVLLLWCTAHPSTALACNGCDGLMIILWRCGAERPSCYVCCDAG